MIIDIKNERLGNFIKSIMHSPFPYDRQRHFGAESDGFTEDLFTIEMAKYFYIGEEAYMSDPTPRRLACTSSFSVKRIVLECKDLSKQIRTAGDALDFSSNGLTLHVRNAGRGLGLILLTECYEWNFMHIIHDIDHRYSWLIKDEFSSFQFYSDEKDRPTVTNDGGEEYVFETKRFCR